MVSRGRVQKGVVVLDDDVRLPEGQEVTVLVGGPVPAAPSLHRDLDIPAVSLGALLRAPNADHDLLGEMLDGRP